VADEHARLFELVLRVPHDYEPYGTAERDGPDCSAGCKYARKLAGKLGFDWVACTNPSSHRVGLLTFEHQGCPQFVQESPE
jgi:hypothetical protein